LVDPIHCMFSWLLSSTSDYKTHELDLVWTLPVDEESDSLYKAIKSVYKKTKEETTDVTPYLKSNLWQLKSQLPIVFRQLYNHLFLVVFYVCVSTFDVCYISKSVRPTSITPPKDSSLEDRSKLEQQSFEQHLWLWSNVTINEFESIIFWIRERIIEYNQEVKSEWERTKWWTDSQVQQEQTTLLSTEVATN